MIYIDTTVRFHSNQVDSITDSIKKIGTLFNYKNVKLNCYSNEKIFDWFNEKPETFNSMNLIKTNVLAFHRNFLTSLILKAWVTCALDENCISPPGSSPNGGFLSSLLGCKHCGCHRYDENAITIINSYFYGYPKHSKIYLPAYSFTLNQTKLFTIEKNFGMNYF